MELGEYLHKHRKSIVELSFLTGIGISSIYKYLDGHSPSFNNAVKIEKATGGLVKVEDVRKPK